MHYYNASSSINPFSLYAHVTSEGIRNIELAFSSSSQKVNQVAQQSFATRELSAGDRVLHFTVGALLTLPIINVVTYLALRVLGLVHYEEEKNLY